MSSSAMLRWLARLGVAVLAVLIVATEVRALRSGHGAAARSDRTADATTAPRGVPRRHGRNARGLVVALARRFEVLAAGVAIAGWAVIQGASLAEGRFPLPDLGLISVPLVPAALFLAASRQSRAESIRSRA